MKVPKEILQNWQENLDSGDKGKISELGISHPIVTKAFEGEASEEVITKINGFFNEKLKRVKNEFQKNKA